MPVGTIQTANIADNAVTNAKFRQSTGLCVVGVAANTTGNVADIALTAVASFFGMVANIDVT